MPLQDTINYIRAIKEEICTAYDDFNNSIEQIKQTVHEDEVINLSSLFEENIVAKSKVIIQEAQNEYQKYSEPLENMQSEIQKLKQLKNETRQDLENKVIELGNLENDIKIMDEQETSLQSLKDIVKTYKILTGTNFVYEKDCVEGYVASRGHFETFKFGQECTPQEITNNLWALLHEISNKDATDVVEDTTLDD